MLANQILNSDCLEGLSKIDNEVVDLIVTSPPYKTKDGYSEELMESLFGELFRVLKSNSLAFVNFGHLSEEKERPFRVLFYALQAGFKLNDTIAWVKTQFSPIKDKRHLYNLTEFIFLLYKGEMPELDRLSIGVPYMDKSNIKRFYKEGNSGIRCGGNVWYIKYPTIQRKSQKLHKDGFPEELPTRCIKLSGLKSGLVLDPFMGAGTTAVAAKKLGLDYLGYEMNPTYFQIAQERIKNLALIPTESV